MDRWDPSTPIDRNPTNTERRIGIRVPSPGIDVEWVADAERGQRWVGHVTEVSVTGASIDAPSDLPITVASVATLRYGAIDSRVVVRHISPTRHPDVTRYGIEWTSLEDPLRRVVFGLVSDARRLSA